MSETIVETKVVMLVVGNRNVETVVAIDKIKELQSDVVNGMQDAFLNVTKYDHKASINAKTPYDPCIIRRKDISMIFVTDKKNITIPQIIPGSQGPQIARA